MREMLHVDKAVAEVNAGFDYRNHAHMVLSEQMSAGFSEDFA
jgi:hypothetical protein